MLLCNQQQFKKKLLHYQHTTQAPFTNACTCSSHMFRNYESWAEEKKKMGLLWRKNEFLKKKRTQVTRTCSSGMDTCIIRKSGVFTFVCDVGFFEDLIFDNRIRGKRCQITILQLSWPIVTTTLISAQIFTRVSCGHDVGENYVIQGSVGRSSYQKMLKIN